MNEYCPVRSPSAQVRYGELSDASDTEHLHLAPRFRVRCVLFSPLHSHLNLLTFFQNSASFLPQRSSLSLPCFPPPPPASSLAHILTWQRGLCSQEEHGCTPCSCRRSKAPTFEGLCARPPPQQPSPCTA